MLRPLFAVPLLDLAARNINIQLPTRQAVQFTNLYFTFHLCSCVVFVPSVPGVLSLSDLIADNGLCTA